MRETTSKDRFRRALLLMKPAHTGHHPGAVPGFRPSPGNSEETTTRVSTEEISVLFRVPTWDPTHPGSPVSRALPGNTPTQGPTREGKPGFFLGGGGNPGRNPGHGLGKTRERGGFRVFPGWYCWGLQRSFLVPLCAAAHGSPGVAGRRGTKGSSTLPCGRCMLYAAKISRTSSSSGKKPTVVATWSAHGAASRR